MTDPKLGGWRAEAADERDYSFTQALTALPLLTEATSGTRVDLRQYCSPVENQRDVGSCVGNSVVGALELLEILRGDPYVDLSRLFVYYNARAAMNAVDKDDGSFIRDAMQSLATFGVCSETVWPYDTKSVLIRPSWKAYREAYAHKISKFYKIFSRGEQRITEIESALRRKLPVVFGALVYEPFLHSRGPVAMPEGECLGGHAMLIVGFDAERRIFIVRNSWGTGWGDQGYCYMPYEYLEAAEADDFWVPTL